MTNQGTVSAYPLCWPVGWPRTSLRDQKANAAWKRSTTAYQAEVRDELKRMRAPQFVVSTNVRDTGGAGFSDAAARAARDPGVAVYFDRPVVEDFKWMNTLMLVGVPTEGEIDDAWKRLALPHHPDRGGDLAVFQALTEARDRGRKWVRRQDAPPALVIACDTFTEVRLNLCALALSLKAIRQLERCGTSQLLERTFQGLQTLLPATGTEAR